MQKQTSNEQEIDMNDFDFRCKTFKKVFGTDEGKLVIEFLENLYSPKQPNFNPNVDYYMLGKYRVIKEIKDILNKQPKKGKKDE